MQLKYKVIPIMGINSDEVHMFFEKNILAIYGDRGKAWLKSLPEQVREWEAKWDLNSLTPLDNLSYNYVLSGYRHQTPIILKLNPDAFSLNREADALEAFAGHGAVALLDRQKNALLLQRAIPGTSLKNHPKAIEIACSVIEKLHRAPVPKEHTFLHITEWLSDLDKEWDLPQVYLEKARSYKDRLVKSSEPCILLHGDLHQENILSHGDDWVVIDPKGVIGYPINEVWACVENLDYDLKYIAHHFNYSLEDVTQWYFVHLILAACWQVEDNLDPTRFLNLANASFG